MKNIKISRLGAIFLTTILVATFLSLPLTGALTNTANSTYLNKETVIFEEDNHPMEPIQLDTIYTPKNDPLLLLDQNDIGYNVDSGNTVQRSLPLYIGENIDQGVPGRGRIGTLDPSGDTDDYYRFTVCEGQDIEASISTSEDFGIDLCDYTGQPIGGQTHTADITGIYFVHIFMNEGASGGEYTFSVSLDGQNDADTSSDAGNDINSATSISPGSYSGYMDMNDQEDWYSFTANSGQGIFVNLEVYERSDYDINLFNPSGELVYTAQWYGDDELEYPADASGIWKIQLFMFPGWDSNMWPDDYFLYGSGAYDIDLTVGGTADSPPGPIPQPEITPIAQTFIVDYKENSKTDEFGYLAAIPAANYIDNGERYLSPIIYQGCDLTTEWFGTVDDTTQYLIDDWNAYLERHEIVSEEFNVPSNPIEAAASIATSKWTSSDTAVLAVDGSVYSDELEVLFDEDDSLSSSPTTTSVFPGNFKKMGTVYANQMWFGKDVGAIHLIGLGDNFGGDTGVLTTKLHPLAEDWWPYPYDFNGPDYDTFFPILNPGPWWPYVTSESGLDELQIIQYEGKRYTIPVDDTASSIEVTITTDEPSNLIVYLVDPELNLRKPDLPHYNGGDIEPIHYWNGGHWQHNYDEFRSFKLPTHDDYTISIHYPMEGKWTAIVVPYLDENEGDVGYGGNFHITAQVRKHNPNRINTEMSAANAAVIASANHAPLLYVTEDSIPSQTSDALTQLGVSDIIFVNIGEVSSVSPSGSVTEYTTMQQVIDAIKADSNTENFVTITSLGSGEGYFAPAAMAAAYHISPVLNIGETPGAYNQLGQAATWREYAGDYYHGCLALGHLPDMSEPLDWKKIITEFLQDGKFPPLGFDLKLRWMSGINQGIMEMITNYGLDQNGKEAYLFVADRENDIRDLVCRAMTGNNSYAGHIPGKTAEMASAHIVRDILYPALIYANPGRDVTTSQLMNFPDGGQWRTNDGVNHDVFSSRDVKEAFSAFGRFYEGHCTWDNLLERYNTGASISYYSGHGTGGSGISAQYTNVEETFPFAEVTHENLKDFDWWDAWRGYMYDDVQTKSPRWGGFTWYNAVEANLYDLIHFKYVDQLFENLHSIFDLWMSCTTAAHLGPNVYLSHGAALAYGNAGTGLCPQADLLDDLWIRDMAILGHNVGESLSKYIWLHQRDYTTLDPTTLYGSSSLQVTNVQVIFGDPTMYLYSPQWIEPEPIEA